VDPESAERIHPNNLKRVIRALEIYQTTGVPASVLYEEDSKRPPRYSDAAFVGLRMERQTLYARIDWRVDEMVRAGLVDEVKSLLERGVNPELPSMRGLGYKEIVGYIRGEYGKDEACALIKKNTRRFAKRQYTWFNADARIKWIDVDGLTAAEVSSIAKELIG
jgi:tRNA dimethylallyltransferase